ncbi:ATPase [Aquipluma nitroreducens]|uniref:ATPase n=1 Tax=Aquipluma nitroreducens TaxID=2010828 RepID=A0A5K7SAS1_9BACT|nr:AAA family ATPase [Aquipluma nitroreducens]BBE18537.1 ATPase [Aquipluma nitroreducens]
MYLKRDIDLELSLWSKDTSRKPLLLRGARQVGKSTAIRALAANFEHYLEINFEEQKQVHQLFAGNLSPEALCENLSVLYNIPIIPEKTLIFFDEIQACIPAISSLRFFYEKMPELHLIAAGSLLEFALEELPSFGVGRIRSMFLYPFSFDEFLLANKEELLLNAKRKASPDNPLPEPLHNKLLEYLKRFLIIGGMPEVVSNYVQGKNMNDCQRVLDDLIISLKADFSKYKQNVPVSRISEVFESVVEQVGGKFVYAKAATEANLKQIKVAIDLLVMAGLTYPVVHTSANGIPLGAESDHKKRKMLIFDTGIFQRLLGLNIAEVLLSDRFSMINKGSLAELFVGLELLKSVSCYEHQSLYYWQREALNSNAEVDYLILKGQTIIPVEVKAGTKGSMQSLFLFLKEKNRPFGIRLSLENFAVYDQIRVFPLYAVSNLVQSNL